MSGIKVVLHPVSDLAAAKPVYTALLGAPPQHDAEYYVGYDVEGGQHVGLVPGGEGAPVAYWEVDDIEAKLAEVTAAGGSVRRPRTRWAAPGRSPPSPTPTATSIGLVQDR
jgi:predicted enzyme related to lactoylglutathione lyase